ncbi:MAG TPA: hypothetical protein VGR90_09845 [Acidimicrobiales bacterium]|nr:hypothetical protein [Acidimicrobiales bacterium]
MAYAIAVFGCGVADFLHLDAHMGYLESGVLFAVVILAFVLYLATARPDIQRPPAPAP